LIQTCPHVKDTQQTVLAFQQVLETLQRGLAAHELL